MSERYQFEKWAKNNVGQPSFGGYHGTLGVWIYRHNFIQMCWLCWQAAKADERKTFDPELREMMR